MQDSESGFVVSVWTATTLAVTLMLTGCGSSDSASSSAAPQSSGSTAASARTSSEGETPRPAPTPTPSPTPSPSPTPPPSPLPGPTTSAATLSWVAPTTNTDGSALTDLGGYRIYYGTSSNQLTSTITINNPGLQIYVVDDLPIGTTYYFAMTAITYDGVEGADSPIVSKLIS
jgi:hypothetical protein